MCLWLVLGLILFKDDTKSEFMVIQSRQQNELDFVICDKILFNFKIPLQVFLLFLLNLFKLNAELY